MRGGYEGYPRRWYGISGRSMSMNKTTYHAIPSPTPKAPRSSSSRYAFHLSRYLPFAPARKSNPPLLSPRGPPSNLDPEHRAREKDDGRDEREAPSATHAVEHLDDDSRGRGAHQAPNEVVGGGGGGGALGVEVDEEHGEDVEGCCCGEPNDEEEDEWDREGRFEFERPSEAEDCGDARVERGPDYLDARKLKGKIAHVVAAFDVDGHSGALGDAFVVHVH